MTDRAVRFVRLRAVTLPALPFDWNKVPKLTITGCGTACYAGMVAKYWFESLARLPVEVEVASELRYREPPLPEGGVCIVLELPCEARFEEK